jgi:transposase
MRPVSVFANRPSGEIEQLREDLRGRWRQGARAMMVLLSAYGLPPAQIADLLGYHPDTVRRWISRCNDEGQRGWPTGSGPDPPLSGLATGAQCPLMPIL